MELRTLGRSGLKVSRLALGTMMLGRWGNTDREDCVRIVQRALDAGINLVDTSNNYGEGDSEEIVGRAVEGRRDEVVLATKVWAPVGPGPFDRGLSRKAIQQQVERSLRRLGTDVIDLYQIHRPDPGTPWEETLSALTDLVRQGKVRYLGCSTSHRDDPGGIWGRKLPAWELVETLWIAERNGFERWISVQPPYSILRRTAELEHFPASLKHGLGNIVWSPLEGGWLTGKYRKGGVNPVDSPRSAVWVGDLANPVFERRKDVVEQLLALAAHKGVALADLAIAFTLRHPAVTSCIIGPRTLGQLEACLRAEGVGLSDADAAAIDALVPPGGCVL